MLTPFLQASCPNWHTLHHSCRRSTESVEKEVKKEVERGDWKAFMIQPIGLSETWLHLAGETPTPQEAV